LNGGIVTEKATFAAGCFWGIQGMFDQIEGVSDTTVGYTGGETQDPTYEQVCSHGTGHAEAVLVEFDPAAVSYDELLDLFWKMHDPTQVNRQGPDIGSQYRSAVYFSSPEQELAAKESRERAQERFSRPIATEITAASTFWPAEKYHQKYYLKHGVTCRLPG